MFLVGIDIGKNKHSFCIIEKETGELIVKPKFFDNNNIGFEELISSIQNLSNQDILIGMEDTGHYHFALLKFITDHLIQKSSEISLVSAF